MVSFNMPLNAKTFQHINEFKHQQQEFQIEEKIISDQNEFIKSTTHFMHIPEKNQFRPIQLTMTNDFKIKLISLTTPVNNDIDKETRLNHLFQSTYKIKESSNFELIPIYHSAIETLNGGKKGVSVILKNGTRALYTEDGELIQTVPLNF